MFDSVVHWVRLTAGADWQVAQRRAGEWFILGAERGLRDVAEIGAEVLTPESGIAGSTGGAAADELVTVQVLEAAKALTLLVRRAEAAGLPVEIMTLRGGPMGSSVEARVIAQRLRSPAD